MTEEIEKRYIRAVITPTTTDNISVEYLDYPANRNHRIAIKRAVLGMLISGIVLILAWSIGIWMMNK